MNSREWRELRNRKVAANPLCERCLQQGVRTSTRVVHHIIPIESGKTEQQCRELAFRWSNLQSLCFQCHADVHGELRSFSTEKIKERQSQRLATWKDSLINRFTNKNNKDNGQQQHDNRGPEGSTAGD